MNEGQSREINASIRKRRDARNLVQGLRGEELDNLIV